MSEQAEHPSWFDLSEHNTLAIPARARHLVSVSTRDELVAAVQAATTSQQSFIVLGEGSNTVFTQDFDGTVILNRLMGIELSSETTDGVTLAVSAGENWHQLVEFSVQQGWYGLENLALIPGLVGAAPIQNIGAYGVEVKDIIDSVDVYDVAHDQHHRLLPQECEFSYRDSRFKHDWAETKIITSVQFRLSKQPNYVLSYPALRQRLSSEPTLQEVFDTVVAIRSEKLPDPASIPNAGSFFKNPVVNAGKLHRLQNQYPELVYFKHGEHFKLAAAWLIEQAGWKSNTHQGVGVHQQQALVLINPQRASGQAVVEFARAVQQDVLRRFQVQLEIEPRLVP